MSVPPLPIIDPHFHIWDTHARPNPNLGELADRLPTYSLLDYERDCGVGVAGCVHVETIVGQTPGGPATPDPVDETRFVLEQAGAEGVGRNVRLVGFVKLSQLPEAEAVLRAHQHVGGARFVGVRMILNHSAEDPALTWPQVDSGAYLTGGVPGFKEGFALLAKQGLSFDLQCNWFQLQEAAAFLAADFQDTVVVVNHLGCLKLGAGPDEDARRVAVWRAGMAALARLPHVHVKLSMLEYVRQGWQDPASEAHGVVKGLVRETIDLFGAGRCMFASNFPVDKLMAQTSLEELVAAQNSLVADLPDDQRRALFHDTAGRVYKLTTPPQPSAPAPAPAPAPAAAEAPAEPAPVPAAVSTTTTAGSGEGEEEEGAGGAGAAATAAVEGATEEATV